MTNSSPPPAVGQVAAACRQLIDSPGLPFADYLPEEQVERAIAAAGTTFRRRLFSPAITLWTFLSQTLDPDGCCRQAVTRFLAWRVASGRAACSADTSAYCKARERLPEQALCRLTRATGRDLLAKAPTPWLWKGRPVKVADGTILSMPDTPKNQRDYPQQRRSKPGCGFPLVRLVVLFSLAVGTVLDAALGKYRGQGEGEQSLFRQLWDNLQQGDVLLGDRLYCCYWVIAAVRQRHADAVLRLNGQWQKTLRHCKRLPNGDRLLQLPRPRRPAWLSTQDYALVPTELWLRVVRVRVRQRGFRTRLLWVATTLRDPQAASSAELAQLYRARWQAELDLRSLKQTLQMDVLRCKEPALVRKEIWAHLLAYNLVRAVMAQAAQQAGCQPRDVSLTATVQLLNAFLPYLRAASTAAERARLWAALLQAAGGQRVGQRPDRVEPHRSKRRPKTFPFLMEPRSQAKARLRAAA
jgi:Transposase DDE domain/Insertion element 4 transposase N-terminal